MADDIIILLAVAQGELGAAGRGERGDELLARGGAQYLAMPEGQMFYSVTYGKNKMGSYASQLNTEQRWMVIAYIKSKQAAATAKPAATPSGAAAAGGGSDSTAAKK